MMILAPSNNLERLKAESDPKFTETRRVYSNQALLSIFSSKKTNKTKTNLIYLFQMLTNGLLHEDFLDKHFSLSIKK